MNKKGVIIAIIVTVLLIAAAGIFFLLNNPQKNDDAENPSTGTAQKDEDINKDDTTEVFTDEKNNFSVEIPEKYQYDESMSSENTAVFSDGEDKSEMMCVMEFEVKDESNPFNEIFESYIMFGCEDMVKDIDINGYKAITVAYPAAGGGDSSVYVNDVSIFVPEKNMVYQFSAVEPASDNPSDLHMMQKVIEAAQSFTLK